MDRFGSSAVVTFEVVGSLKLELLVQEELTRWIGRLKQLPLGLAEVDHRWILLWNSKVGTCWKLAFFGILLKRNESQNWTAEKLNLKSKVAVYHFLVLRTKRASPALRTVHRMSAKKEKWAQEGAEFTTSITRGDTSKVGQLYFTTWHTTETWNTLWSTVVMPWCLSPRSGWRKPTVPSMWMFCKGWCQERDVWKGDVSLCCLLLVCNDVNQIVNRSQLFSKKLCFWVKIYHIHHMAFRTLELWLRSTACAPCISGPWHRVGRLGAVRPMGHTLCCSRCAGEKNGKWNWMSFGFGFSIPKATPIWKSGGFVPTGLACDINHLVCWKGTVNPWVCWFQMRKTFGRKAELASNCHRFLRIQGGRVVGGHNCNPGLGWTFLTGHVLKNISFFDRTHWVWPSCAARMRLWMVTCQHGGSSTAI